MDNPFLKEIKKITKYKNIIKNYNFESNYDYVDDLIEDKENIINNCNLLLIWTEPNESKYDYDAIKKLNPQSFIIYYELGGGAGGDKMHTFLNKCKNGSTKYKLVNSDYYKLYDEKLSTTIPIFNFALECYIKV